jgi:hypothetical protein
MNLKNKIENCFPVATKEEFDEVVDFFTNNTYQGERLSLYQERSQKEGIKLEEAKQFYLEECFNKYILNKLNEALEFAIKKRRLEAYNAVLSLEVLEPIFKDYDIKSFTTFITDTDKNLTEQETKLLFLKPILSSLELNQIYNAIVKSLINANEPASSKSDFVIKYVNHPLMKCLNSYHTFNDISEFIDKDTLETGIYRDLIKAVLKVRKELNDEEFHSFISFLTIEDITKGFSNIIKNRNYKPSSVLKVLDNVANGEEIYNFHVRDIIEELKQGHIINYALNADADLEQNKNSKFSLNDFGQKFEIDFKEFFLHGHTTDNSGNQQNGQHPNTTATLMNKGINTVGVSIIKQDIMHDRDAREYLYGFSQKLNISQLGGVILSTLQFDGDFFRLLSTDEKLLSNIHNNNILSSNILIIKEDIENSALLASKQANKNDFQIICEKKSFYSDLMINNPDFFKKVLSATASNNQMLYQFISKSLLNTIKSILDIEEELNIGIFTQKELNAINNILEVELNNVEIKALRKDILKQIKKRDSFENQIDQDKYKSLINLAQKDTSLIYSDKEPPKLYKGHLKVLANPNANILESFESHPLDLPEYSKQYRNKIMKALKERIIEDANKLLSHYRMDKKERIINGLKSALNELDKEKIINFVPTDSLKSYVIEKSIADLFNKYEGINLSNRKNESAQEKDLKVLSLVCAYANITGGKIRCHKEDITPEIKKFFKTK